MNAIQSKPLVVRMLNPAAAFLPEVKALALASNSRCQDPEFRTMKLLNSCQDPRVGIFVGLEAGRPKAMAAIELPFDDIRISVALVAVTTNFGSRALGQATWNTAATWAREMGVRRLYAANMSGASDAAYMRNIRAHGVKIRPVYTWMEINIGDPDDSDPGPQQMPSLDRVFDFESAPFRAMRTAAQASAPVAPEIEQPVPPPPPAVPEAEPISETA